MKISVVICEYNPFHRGHEKQIRQIREQFHLTGEDCAVISLMSGNFVQRGEPAIFDKYTRAAAAIAGGSDLVLELPFPFCAGGAAYFAQAGVRLADSLGCADFLFFGSESGDMDRLAITARRLEDPDFCRELEDARQSGIASPESDIRLRHRLYTAHFGDSLPETPNDILGVEYIAALLREQSPICPVALLRQGTESAADARRRMIDGEDAAELIPPAAAACMTGSPLVTLDSLGDVLLACLRLAPPGAFDHCDGAEGGLGRRIAAAASDTCDITGLLTRCATKKYTAARIRRTLLNGILGVTRDQLNARPAFTTVLALNDRGRSLLAHMRKTARIPIHTKPSAGAHAPLEEVRIQHAMNARADALYALALHRPGNFFLKQHPVIVPGSHT